MRAPNIVFIGGTHGVGKGHFCIRLAPLIDGDHITASGLIRNRKALGLAKTISGIDANQAILVKELDRYSTSKSCVLLDGHFCLYNARIELEILPIELYKALNVSYIVLLTCLPATIVERLSHRDENRSELSLENIQQLQRTEIEHARKVAQALNVPITELDVSAEKTPIDLDLLVAKLKGLSEI